MMVFSQSQSALHLDVDALFQRRVRGLHQVSKRENHKATAPVVYCFRALGNLMELEVRGFEITSPTKKICLNYHLNKLLQFKCFI